MRGVVEGSVVEWDEDGSNVRPGPNKRFYDSCRKECGAHLTYNAFWEVQNFCVQQMLPRDGMHAIDLGAITRLILAIPRKFWVCVEIIVDMEYAIKFNMQNMQKKYAKNIYRICKQYAGFDDIAVYCL